MIATVGVDDAGQAYNVNADTVAGAIAEALDAEKLVYLTDVAGLYERLARRVVADLAHRRRRARAARSPTGKVSEGMIPKSSRASTRCAAACARAHILDGRIPHALLLEFFTREGVGTMVHAMTRDDVRTSSRRSTPST